ncbi:GATA transcription factor 13 [Hordeum vulgare]|nr:GATA transcription factor 13 [Hordeum vulgare]
MFTMLLDRNYSRRVYVPCSVRSHHSRYIEEYRALAIRRGDKDTDLALQSSEGYLYGVLFTHGRMSSKFHGPSWEELVKDYGLRHRDMMTVMLEHYGTMIGVDFHWDGVMLFPLPCVGKLFDDNYIICSPFVHRITYMNVNGQHMVIPSLVVSSLKDFLSIPRTGSLPLEIGLDSEDDDIYVSIPCSYFIGLGGTMVFKKERFSNFLRASSIEVNNFVLITFKERDHELVVIFNPLPQ